MKRHFLFLAVLMAIMPVLAEDIPENYYDAIDGQQDAALKTALSLIIRNGDRYEYGTTTYHSSNNPPEWQKGDLKAYGTWQALPFTDHKPGTQGGVWDMYSNCVRYYPNKLGESGCSLNIEHCLPKSWWGWNKDDTRDSSWVAYKDLYNLNPSDQRANSQKSNYAPGHVSTADKFDNGSFRMSSAKKSEYGYICFEPEEEYRGDFARTYFYMATAYEHIGWNAYPQYVSDDNYLMFSDAIIQVLLDWHRADPVSDKEICRADQISNIQCNRNPYIDYPELVEYIWGNKKGETVNLASLTKTFKPDCCQEETNTPEPQIYDTLINLPIITATYINAIKGDITGNANSGIQSNGSASITMGKSNTDGEISFSGIALKDTAVLAFRASPYNSASSMQLDIYANEQLIRSIEVEVQQETRNEIRYRIPIPQDTHSIKLVSVGGSTSKRACIQELYLLVPKKDPTGLIVPEYGPMPAYKEIRNGQVRIIRNKSIFTILGQTIR